MIHVFLGTKAQLIKMAPIMLEMESRNIEYNFIFSGQHQETIDSLLDMFGLRQPDICLHEGSDITSIPQAISWSTKILFHKVPASKLWKEDKTGVVLNHGDTFSTLLGSILAKKNGLQSAHIESGLRSYNYLNPFPEELTRIATFNLTDMFFCPGNWAYSNVKKYKGIKVNTKENTLLDSLKLAIEKHDQQTILKLQESYAVVSIHRFENIFHKGKLQDIVSHLNKASKQVKLVFITHKPTLAQLEKFDLLKRIDKTNIILEKRMDYFSFIKLISDAEFIISDGGSNQEECSYLGKPCLLFRNKTERKEGLDKNVFLSEFDEEKIMKFISNYKSYSFPRTFTNDFSPSKNIVDHLLKYQ